MGHARIGCRRLGFLLSATVVLTSIAGIRTASADPVKCQRAISKASATFAQARLKALAKCEQAKRKGKLPAATVCAAEPKTVPQLASALAELDAALDKACGGSDKTCGTGSDDESLAAISWPGACPDLEDLGCTSQIGNCNGIADCVQCVDERAVDQALAFYYGSLAPAAAGSALGKCQMAIGNETTKFYAAKAKALAKCWDLRLVGKHSDVCPNAAAPAGSPPEKAAAAIAKAESKKIVGICKACGGADGACDGAGDLSPVAIGFPANCPAVASCGGAVTNLAQLVTCVDCVTEFKVDCAQALAIPALVPYPAACGQPVATATQTPAASATPTATVVTATATRTATPLPTATATTTATPVPSVTATRTTTPLPSVTATPSGAVCGNGVIESGEDCDDGNTVNCDSCPSNCKTSTAPIACPTTGVRHAQTIHLEAPAGAVLSGGLFCIDYPSGVVALPGTGNVSGRVTGLSGGVPFLNDFDNAAQLSFVVNPGQAQLNPVISFDLCTGHTAPLPTAFQCVTKSASNNGNPLDPSTVVCAPM
jgi:cysteine-rich repeat protein